MSATITNACRVHSAISFIENLSGDENVYAYAGKINPWDDENNPDAVSVNYQEFKDVKSSIVYLKKITSANGFLGLKRYDWESGTVYTPWEHDKDMNSLNSWLSITQPYYVFVEDTSEATTQYSVYMCVDNNAASPSTIKPTGQPSNVFSTPDGYKWKFMYNIDTSYTSYISDAFVPCPYKTNQKTIEHIASETNVTQGTINRIRVDTQGTGYTLANTSITITGDGSGATAEVDSFGGSGEILNINIINPGSGYTYATCIITGDGSSAAATCIISPINGHGYDASMQLKASNTLINIGFSHTEGDLFPAQNAYRRIGLIKNIRDTTGTIVSDDQFNFFVELQMSNITGIFPVTQRIVGVSSNASAIVYYIDPPAGSSNASFFVVDVQGSFLIGETVQLEGVPSTLAIISGIIENDKDTLSGDLLYTENIQFVTRKTGQTETFIFGIEF